VVLQELISQATVEALGEAVLPGAVWFDGHDIDPTCPSHRRRRGR
jgi:hypothetical protein